MESVKVKHYSLDGPLLFWVPISLRIEATGPASLDPGINTFVEVIDRPDWECEPFLVERRLLQDDGALGAAIVGTSAGSRAVIWHTFFIHPPATLATTDPSHGFTDRVRLRVGFLGGDGVLLAHTYPPANETGLGINHQPVCFYDAYVLSQAGICQASTAPRSVPPELFNQQLNLRAITQDPELDVAIGTKIHARGYDPGVFVFHHQAWRVHVRVWGRMLDWKRRDDVGRMVNRQIMDANIRLIDEGMNAPEPGPAHLEWMLGAGVTGLGMGGI